MSPQTFDAVLFDMDGTLIDSEPLWLISEKELMAQFDFEWTSEHQAFCLGGPMPRIGLYMNDLAGNPKDGPYFAQALIDLMAQKLSQGAPLMPGALQLLDEVTRQQIHFALVSASPRVLVDGVLRNLASHHFDVSISSDDVTRTKPDPEGYLKAASLLNVDIKRCLILEDSETGTQAAMASGACVVAIPHIVPIAESERVRTVASLEQLTELKLHELYTEWFH